MPYRTLRYGLLALHVVLAVFLSATLNAWTDEYYTLRTTGSGPGHAFQQALAFELQPPLYFTTLSIWRLLIPGLLGARLFSTLLTAVGILVASRASAALLGQRAGLWVAGVLVVHPFVLFLATEARCYAMVFCLSALFLASLLREDGAESPRWPSRLLRIAVAAAGLYTQFYFGFLLVAGAVGLLVLRRSAPLRAYLLDMVVVALLFVPGFLWVPELFERHLDPYAGSGALALGQSKLYVVGLASAYLFPAFGALRIPLVAALVFCAILGLVRPRWPQLRAPVLLLLGVSGTLAVAFVALKMVSGEIVQPRHATVLLLPVVALGFSISALALGRRGVPALAGLVVLCCLAGSWSDFSSLAKEGDWKRVARYVESQERYGEPILVTPAEAHPLFAMYYRGANSCRGYPGPEYAEVWDPRAYVVSDVAEVKRFADGAIGDAPAFWLVANTFHTSAAIDRFVEQYCSVLTEAKFEGCRVQRLRWR